MSVFNSIERCPPCPACPLVPVQSTVEKLLEGVALIAIILFFVFVIEVIRYFTGRRRHGQRGVENGRAINNGNNFYV